MIKKTVNKKIMERLQSIQDVSEKKFSEPMVVDLKQWLDSDEKSKSFQEYLSGIERKHPKAAILVNDLCIQSDIYVPTELIYDCDRQTIKKFVDWVEKKDEIRFMKKYLELFHHMATLGYEKEPSEKRRNMIDEVMRDTMIKCGAELYLDLFNHYRVLSIEELVERYKDQRFFKMCNTQIDYKKAL